MKGALQLRSVLKIQCASCRRGSACRYEYDCSGFVPLKRFYSATVQEAKNDDERVFVSVCLSVCLSVAVHLPVYYKKEQHVRTSPDLWARRMWRWLAPSLATLQYAMHFRFCGWRRVFEWAIRRLVAGRYRGNLAAVSYTNRHPCCVVLVVSCSRQRRAPRLVVHASGTEGRSIWRIIALLISEKNVL